MLEYNIEYQFAEISHELKAEFEDFLGEFHGQLN